MATTPALPRDVNPLQLQAVAQRLKAWRAKRRRGPRISKHRLRDTGDEVIWHYDQAQARRTHDSRPHESVNWRCLERSTSLFVNQTLSCAKDPMTCCRQSNSILLQTADAPALTRAPLPASCDVLHCSDAGCHAFLRRVYFTRNVQGW